MKSDPVEQGAVAALVVTYFPDPGLVNRVNSLLEQFNRVAVVDNGSSDDCLGAIAGLADDSIITLHRNSSNLGIAAALNQGIAQLAAEGFDWIVTLDQDSEIRPDFLTSMVGTLNSCPEQQQVALIGANRISPDSNISHRWLRARRFFPYFERVPCEQASMCVTLVITSGTLTSVAAFNRLGGFRDELFIDLVDFEYCLRARQQGYLILVSCGAKLTHKVGNQTHTQVMGIAVSSTHHSPLRRYYLFRNSIHLIRQYAGAHPHWLIYQLMALCEVILSVAFSENNKWLKLRACLAGIRDGLAGKTGPCSRAFESTSRRLGSTAP